MNMMGLANDFLARPLTFLFGGMEECFGTTEILCRLG